MCSPAYYVCVGSSRFFSPLLRMREKQRGRRFFDRMHSRSQSLDTHSAERRVKRDAVRQEKK